MGKTSTTTQNTTVPSQVLAQYQNVNNLANQTAQQAFTPYSGEFVAPVNSTEQSGITATSNAANEAQPYYGAATSTLNNAQAATTPYYGAATSSLNDAGQTIGGIGSTLAQASPYNVAATGLAAAGAQAVNPTQLNSAAINQYISPYLNTVLGSTAGLLNQNNQQQMNGTLGNIIGSGAFGGDRAGIAAANLEQQQNLANANIYSGIANDAYTNALSTAQQQQGVGLGAAQANRAALQNASTQIQGIGNQVYGQGTGAEQLQYGQQTGLAAAQQGLGQDIYNTGAATSAGLANLGQGAQGAALSGAQAQLAAGQVAQQTQQAQDTAEYNQFLQQQSYPFQVDQFLANIAEGTGALSGSTTTTTQPGGLLSDRRAKDHIRVVGFTFDKQPIYTFRYKGDTTTHMGLMAQDVEKKHPDAVANDGGLKAVNYQKATDKAAERGHFAAGGSPGFDPQLMAEILSNSQGMYGPYMATMGGQAASGGGPYGGSARVPAANLPVSGLRLPQMQINRPQSGLASAANVANDVGSLGKAYDQATALFNPQSAEDSNSANDNTEAQIQADLAQTINGQKRGGLVRARFASGGLPYMGGFTGDLDIPDVSPNDRLQSSGSGGSSGGGGSSGLSDLASLAKLGTAAAPAIGAAASGIGSAISSVLPFLALKNGGRAGFADGGDPSGTIDVNGDTSLEDFANAYAAADPANNAGQQTWSKTLPSTAAMDSAAPSPTLADMRAFTMGAPVASQHSSTSHGSRSSSHKTGGLGAVDPWASGPPDDFSGATPAPPSQVQVNPDAQNPTPVAPVTGLAMDAPPSFTPSSGGLGGALAPAEGIVGSIGSGVKNAADTAGKLTGGFFNKVASGDKPSIMALLSGIAAAGAAQTKYPLIALTQGLGAGANAYQSAQTQQAALGKTQATTGQIGAQTAQEKAAASAQNIANAKQLMILKSLGVIKDDPNGPFTDPLGNRYSPATSQGGPANSVTNPSYKYLGPNTASAVKPAANGFVMDAAYGAGANPERVASSERMAADIDDTGAKSASDLVNLGEQSDAILSSKRNGLTAQGALSPIVQPWVEVWNGAMRAANNPDAVISGLADEQIAKKLQIGQATAMASAAGERSYHALDGYTSASSGPGLEPEAAATLLAQSRVADVKALDRRNVINEARSVAGGNVELQPILNNFDKDYTPEMYNNMRDLITKTYLSPNYPSISAGLKSPPGSQAYNAAVQALDQAGKQAGVPRFSRAFTGQ